MAKLKILIVDDSMVMRRLLTDALAADADLDVVTAAGGRAALDKLDTVKPDLVTLDVEMPDLDGLATLRLLREKRPKLPVIMFSSTTVRGAMATLDALAAGANDYVAKPAKSAGVDETIAKVRQELVPKIKALCGRAKFLRTPAAVPTVVGPPLTPASVMATLLAPPSPNAAAGVVAIGVSTGGPNALCTMMPDLPADLAVPVVIVQHMPPVFTKLLADRLAALCKISVAEAVNGQVLRPGLALIAPGGQHMLVERRGTDVVVRLNEEPPENSCRPAVDPLFRSVAACYGASALGVVMTGMGSDGQKGCEAVRAAGGAVVVQDEATSVVWGMPGAVARAGLAHAQVPLNGIAAEITKRTSIGRRRVA